MIVFKNVGDCPMVMFKEPNSPMAQQITREMFAEFDSRHTTQVAQQVARKRCQCCPGDGDEQMPCGHYRCEICKMRGHDHCIACSLAV